MLGLDVNRDAVVFRERVGYNFKLLAIKSNASRSSIAKMFNVGAHFRDRGRFKIASHHNNVIVAFGRPPREDPHFK